MCKKSNIVLIGMPGSGKSTIGVVLAKVLGYDFVDSDILIQKEKNMTLEEIIEKYGIENFNSIEEEINKKINLKKTVIATGGSAVYGHNAMLHLKQDAIIVFIKLSCNIVRRRLGNIKKRGISIKKGQSFRDLYDERQPLYEKYADVIVDTSGLKVKESMEKITRKIEEVE